MGIGGSLKVAGYRLGLTEAMFGYKKPLFVPFLLALPAIKQSAPAFSTPAMNRRA